MLHDDYTAAAALLQNDPQEGLRRLMELFGGPVHAICTAILRGHAEDADEGLPPILLSVCGATRPACPRARLCGVMWCVRPEAAPLTVTGR